MQHGNMVRFTGAREKVADGLASWRGKGMGGGRGRTIEDGTGVPDADGSVCEGDQKGGLVVSEDEYMRGSREGSNDTKVEGGRRFCGGARSERRTKFSEGSENKG